MSATTAIATWPGLVDVAMPQGTKRFAASERRNPSRIASPSVTSASSGPAYSSTIASWIIVSSRCVDGLSTGIRPVSARITITKATKASRRSGPAAQLGCASVALTIAGRFDVPRLDREREASQRAAPAPRARRSSSPGSTPCHRRPCRHRVRRARAATEPMSNKKTTTKRSALVREHRRRRHQRRDRNSDGRRRDEHERRDRPRRRSSVRRGCALSSSSFRRSRSGWWIGAPMRPSARARTFAIRPRTSGPPRTTTSELNERSRRSTRRGRSW